MGIIIAVAVIIAAVFFKLRYRPEGDDAFTLFGVCMIAGIVMLLTVGSLSSFSGVLFYAVELAVCALIVLSFRCEARREAAARARKMAAAKQRAAEERAIAQRQRRPLSCFAAFTETAVESVGRAA
ncbi:MAG: hypothetical protein E7554_05480 [Ruminococcaceae bacterium]|nr:hypothetical protein [Oscillospiraceae bacterium]